MISPFKAAWRRERLISKGTNFCTGRFKIDFFMLAFCFVTTSAPRTTSSVPLISFARLVFFDQNNIVNFYVVFIDISLPIFMELFQIGGKFPFKSADKMFNGCSYISSSCREFCVWFKKRFTINTRTVDVPTKDKVIRGKHVLVIFCKRIGWRLLDWMDSTPEMRVCERSSPSVSSYRRSDCLRLLKLLSFFIKDCSYLSQYFSADLISLRCRTPFFMSSGFRMLWINLKT